MYRVACVTRDEWVVAICHVGCYDTTTLPTNKGVLKLRKTAQECKELGLCVECKYRPREKGAVCLQCYERRATWKANNREKVTGYGRNWNHKHPEQRRLIEYHNYWAHTQRHLNNASASGKRLRDRVKRETFEAYGGVKCACCGISEIIFLTLDHIAENGAAHRKELIGKGIKQVHGYKLYLHLRADGFPAGFQVLCYNCNSAKHILGICPHNDPPRP